MHNDAHLISKRSVFRIVHIEFSIPHCRPKVVGTEAKQQLKHLCVELGVIFALVCSHPTSKDRLLVVKEYASIFDGRWTLHFLNREGIDRFYTRWYVSPPIPLRYAYLFRYVI